MNTSLASNNSDNRAFGELKMMEDRMNNIEKVDLGIMIPTGDKLIDFKNIQVGEPVNTQGTQTHLNLVSPIYDQIMKD